MTAEPPPAKGHLLVAEDDPHIRAGVVGYLTTAGYQVSDAATFAAAHELFRTARVDLVLADYSLPDGNALQLLKAFKVLDRDVPVIVLTAHGSIDLAVRAI